jgi:hypothetical protein
MAAPEVHCPQCNGLLEPDEGQLFLTCPYCASAVFLDKARVVFHWSVAPTLDEAGARAALRRWMASNETVKDLDVKSQVSSVDFAFFPLWLLRFGQAGSETVHLEPAAATSVTELKRLRLPAGDLIGYEPALDAQAIAPTVPLQSVLSWLETAGTDSSRVGETSLVHVPLYTFHYDFAGQGYTAVVDGATGSVFANIYPAKAEAPYRTIAAVVAGVFLCLAALPVAGAAVDPQQGLELGSLLCLGLGLLAAPVLFSVAAWIAAGVWRMSAIPLPPRSWKHVGLACPNCQGVQDPEGVRSSLSLRFRSWCEAARVMRYQVPRLDRAALEGVKRICAASTAPGLPGGPLTDLPVYLRSGRNGWKSEPGCSARSGWAAGKVGAWSRAKCGWPGGATGIGPPAMSTSSACPTSLWPAGQWRPSTRTPCTPTGWSSSP